MNAFIETLNNWGANLLSFAWPMLWQSSLLIVAVLAFDLVFRRQLRASIRYALWLVVLLKLCVPPTLALPTSPAWWLNRPSPPVAAKTKPHYTVTYDTTPLMEMPLAPLPEFISPKPVLTNAAWLLLASAAVSLMLLSWLLARWWQVTRLVRRSTTSDRLAGLADEAQTIAGMKFQCFAPCTATNVTERGQPCPPVTPRGELADKAVRAPRWRRNLSVPVKLTPNSMSPAVCGLFRPAILIPQALAENFSDEQLRAVLLHELIHLRRRDVWLNFLQSLLQIIYWWHPLVWLANARLRRVREEAVDDAVMLALRDEAESYAPTLLEVAKLALNRPLASLGLVGILESRHALRQRIERLVDFRAPRQAGLTLVSLLGILAFTAVAVPMGEGPALTEPTNPLLPATPAASTATNAPTVLIQAQIYQMRQSDFQMLVSNPAFTESRNDKVRNFQVFLRLLKASELQHISSPRIMTRSGLPAMLFVGNETNGIEFECRPDVTNGLIDLASRIKIISTQAGATETNQLTNQFVSATGGGHVFSINAPGDASGSNIFVAAIGVEIVTNAVPSRSQIIGMLSDTNFQVVRHALEQRSGKESLAEPEVVTASGWSINRISMTNLSVPLAKSSSVPTNGSAPQLTYTGPGRQEIVRKLAMIRLDRVNFTATPLTEVMRVLCQEARERDPEHRGINFVINPVADQAATGKSLDPVTGLPLATNAPPATDMATLPIKVQLTNATLGDVLDAVVLVAPEPIRYSIQDYGVVFSARPPADAAPLFARTFKVDPNTFVTSLLRETRQQEVKIPSGIAPAFKEFCSKLGVDWESPKGKAVYFNDRRGQIYVKATEADLDTIERALATLNSTPPQLHIKARFYEVPKGTLQGMPSFPMSSNSVAGPLTGILTWSNAQVVMRALEARPGFENLAEPEVTTLSGRQTQMRATQVVTVITNFAFHDTYTNKDGLVDTNANISPQTCTVETGPVLDVVPSVLSDGHTINLALIPTMLEFLGYDQSTNTTAAYDQAGEKIDVPTVLPRFRTRQAVATVNLWDDQTAMLRLEPTTLKDLNKIAGIPTISPLLRLGQFWQSQDNEKTNPPKEILVFITATLVDAAGNRVHTDDELPFAQTGVPPQPSQPSPPGAK